MAAQMKRVVQIEGPFNKNDELVDILVPGEAYYYLGTPNRDMDDAELLTMKWAYKVDNGEITPFLKSKYGKLKGKSKMAGSLPPDFAGTSATVYAYFNRPSDDISMRKVVQKTAAAPAAPAVTAPPAAPAVAETGPGILNEMKALVDRNIPYSQTGERSKLSPEGLKNLDCSETVGIYLHKLGVMTTYVAIDTSLMTAENRFRNAIGSNNIDFMPGSNQAGFKPQRGDVFVWRKGAGGPGHTGIVYNYNAAKDLVTILEAIGAVGSADEGTNRANGGTAQKGCSRTAVYQRAGKALNAHAGWVGYFRPKNFTKNL
jgi:hypothetical protein